MKSDTDLNIFSYSNDILIVIHTDKIIAYKTILTIAKVVTAIYKLESSLFMVISKFIKKATIIHKFLK